MLWLLEETGQPYEIVRHDTGAPGGVDDGYRAIHPHKKVPALEHDGATVFESAAICLYVADAFPESGLGPRIGEPGRGAFVSWLAYYAGVIEPGFFARLLGTKQDPQQVGWGRFEDIEATLRTVLSRGPYVLGERFSAADVLFETAVRVAVRDAKLMPEDPVFTQYLDRLSARPALARGLAKDDSR